MSKNENVAYDLSLFEEKRLEVPRVKNNVIQISEDRLAENRRRKINPMSAIKMAVTATVVSTILGVVVYGHVQLTELGEQVGLKAKQLEEQQSIYTQLHMKAESELSLKAIEEYATGTLMMQRMDPSQAEYISISSGDKAEIKQNNEKKGILDKIEELISMFMS